MNRGQLILFVCFSCLTYWRAYKAGRSTIGWVLLAWIGMAVGFYGIGLALYAAFRAFGDGSLDALAISNYAAHAGGIFVAIIVAARAGFPKLKPVEGEQSPPVVDSK